MGVCADDALPGADLLGLLAGLVDKSIVSRADLGDGGDQARYRMLETIADYGGELLTASGERDLLRRRHRDWYRRLVSWADAEWVGHRRTSWSARLTRERAKLRAAIEFCLTTPGEAEEVLRLIVDLPRLYWFGPGAASEGLAWLDRGLAQAPAPTALRARALVHAGHLGVWHAAAVVACALDEPAGTPGEPGTARPLTRREAQVADLVAEGRSNREIATTLFISRRTAESHVEHILTKLGFTARTQIAAWVAEHRCAPDRISSPLPR